jgi:hypothetical protein
MNTVEVIEDTACRINFISPLVAERCNLTSYSTTPVQNTTLTGTFTSNMWTEVTWLGKSGHHESTMFYLAPDGAPIDILVGTEFLKNHSNAFLNRLRIEPAFLNVKTKLKVRSYLTKWQIAKFKELTRASVQQSEESKIQEVEAVHLKQATASFAPEHEYHSDQENDSEMNSDVSSIFSDTTTDSNTYASSIPVLVVQGGEQELVAMLAEDEILKPLYELAATKLNPELFEKTFARFLRIYASDLKEIAADNAQKVAVSLVRSRRRHTAKSIRMKFFAGPSKQDDVIDRLQQQKIDRSKHLENYLRQYVPGADPDANLENGDLEPNSGSESSEEEDQYPPAFPNLDHVRSFMSSGSALPNLRNRLKSFLQPQPSEMKEVLLFDRLSHLPTVDAPVQDEVIIGEHEIGCGHVGYDLVSLKTPSECGDLDSPFKGIEQRGISGAKFHAQIVLERDQASDNERSSLEVSAEQYDDVPTTVLNEGMVRWLQAKTLIFISGLAYDAVSLFKESTLSAGNERLRWRCVSHDSKTNMYQR